MNFKDMIEGKSVLLLGPAFYLYDGAFQEDLNDYDIVVKLNRMVETDICKDFKNDRCDVLYHCINVERSIGEAPVDFEVLTRKNVSLLRIPYPPVKQWYINNINRYKQRNYYKNFPTNIVDAKTYLDLVKLCQNSSPNTGTIAIYDLFLQKPKSLTIRGITMFSGGYNTDYRDKIVTEKEVRDLNALVKNHDIEKQKTFLRAFLDQKEIIIDKNLRESVYGKN